MFIEKSDIKLLLSYTNGEMKGNPLVDFLESLLSGTSANNDNGDFVNVIDATESVGTVIWTKSDIIRCLENANIPITEENINIVAENIDSDVLEDKDAGDEYIAGIIEDFSYEFVKSDSDPDDDGYGDDDF